MKYHPFNLNKSGYLNKYGENTIYLNDKEVVKFGVARVQQGEMFLAGGFLSLYPGHGYGKHAIIYLFYKLPCLTSISLICKDHVLPFWLKCGGRVKSTSGTYNTVVIEKINLVV